MHLYHLTSAIPTFYLTCLLNDSKHYSSDRQLYHCTASLTSIKAIEETHKSYNTTFAPLTKWTPSHHQQCPRHKQAPKSQGIPLAFPASPRTNLWINQHHPHRHRHPQTTATKCRSQPSSQPKQSPISPTFSTGLAFDTTSRNAPGCKPSSWTRSSR